MPKSERMMKFAARQAASGSGNSTARGGRSGRSYEDGERRTGKGSRDGENRGSYGKPYGEKPAYGNGGRGKPYGEKPAYGNGGRGKPYGEKPAYGNGGHGKPYGEKPAYGNGGHGKPYGEKPAYGNGGHGKPYGEKPAYGNGGRGKPYGEKPAYADRAAKPYGQSGDAAGFGLGRNDAHPAEAAQRPDRFGQARPGFRPGFGTPAGAGHRVAVRPGAGRRPAGEEPFENPNLVIGRNPVTEAIRSGRPVDRILMQKDSEGSAKMIAALAREAGLQLQYVDKIVLDKLCPGKVHQGVAAFVAAHEYAQLEDILRAAEKKGEDPFIVLLDGLEDPHNLGAILRSADGAGAHGVVIPSRRSVSLTDTVAKASAGAIEYVPVAKVNNLAATIDELKKKGIWVAAVDMGGVNYPDAGLTGPLAVVIGSEGDGISRLVREKCDFVVGIPMQGRVNSLNASNAAAIVMYEAARQRAMAKVPASAE